MRAENNSEEFGGKNRVNTFTPFFASESLWRNIFNFNTPKRFFFFRELQRTFLFRSRLIFKIRYYYKSEKERVRAIFISPIKV